MSTGYWIKTEDRAKRRIAVHDHYAPNQNDVIAMFDLAT